MITQKEFNYIKGLVETENQLLYRLNEGYINAAEPQLKEELQKMTAEVTNERAELLGILEDQNNE